VVTGGGKTIFAAQCILSFVEAFPVGKVFVVVPTTALLDQWIMDIKDEIGATDSEIAVFSGEEKSAAPHRVNLIVINSARQMLSRLAAGGDTFLIVDECHRAGSEKNALVLRGEFRATLGLSATPVREYDDGFQRFVEPALGRVIYEYNYVQAKQDGIIVPFDLVNVEFSMLPHEEADYQRLTNRLRALIARKEKGHDVEELIRITLRRRAAVSANSLLRIPLSVKLIVGEAGQRSIVFHERVPAANKILKSLKAVHVRATPYHTGISPDIRRDNLRLFRRGMFDCLVCCRALDEGMNIPSASVAVIASSTASQRQRIQRLGRVLRPAPGKPAAKIYTLFATSVERARLEKEADSLEGVAKISWLRATVSFE
jgi:superfamily II DNA or RNA helicase